MTPPPVGFTGARAGVTRTQAETCWSILGKDWAEGVREFHHGDCVGADASIAAYAMRTGFRIIGHPPNDPSRRAWFPCDELLPERPYLDRNRAIVDVSGRLLACPDGPDRLRSGTWSTIRYARRSGLAVRVVMPDGTVTG